MKSIKKLFFLLIVAGLVAVAVFYFRDTKAPLINLTPDSGPVSAKTKLALGISDSGMGLKNVQVHLIQGSNRLPLLQQDFTPQTTTFEQQLDLSGLNLEQGQLRIEVSATDQAIYHFGKGNTLQKLFDLTYDTRPPVISILSKAHNFTKGGSGLVTFKLDEEADQAGVQFADHFFPAYLQDSGIYACLFAYPYYVEESSFVPRVVARDRAGNERQAGLYYRANPKNFRQRKINISKNFLDLKTPEFEALVPDGKSPLDTFLYVNRQIREQNRKQIAALASATSPVPLWEGAFTRQPKAAALAQFADHRTYYHEGQVIDKAVHWGQDLASTAQAEIIAENAGKVVWAEYLGIYGQCVVIDHGLGLQSLYAHLSQINVQKGDSVTKGQVIGRSGATGMAGGDHLHLGITVAGIPVQPIEWWDQSWLNNNIDGKLHAQ